MNTCNNFSPVGTAHERHRRLAAAQWSMVALTVMLVGGVAGQMAGLSPSWLVAISVVAVLVGVVMVAAARAVHRRQWTSEFFVGLKAAMVTAVLWPLKALATWANLLLDLMVRCSTAVARSQHRRATDVLRRAVHVTHTSLLVARIACAEVAAG